MFSCCCLACRFFFLSLFPRNCCLVSRIEAFLLGCTALCSAMDSNVLTAQLLSFLSDRKLLSRFHLPCSLIGCLAFKSCFHIRPSSVGPLLCAYSHVGPLLPIVMGYPLLSEVILDVLVMVPCMCINRAHDLLCCHLGNTWLRPKSQVDLPT